MQQERKVGKGSDSGAEKSERVDKLIAITDRDKEAHTVRGTHGQNLLR